MIGPTKFLRYFEQQQLCQPRRIDVLLSAVWNGIAVRATTGSAAETIAVVGNAQAARYFDCRTQVATTTTIGAAGYNAAAITFSQGHAKYHAVGNTEAVYESVLGATWGLVAGASSAAHPLFDIDSGSGSYVLAVGGNSAGDAIYQFRTAGSLTMSVAPDLFTRVKWHPGAARFIVAGATTIRAFDPTSSTTSLLETHPEGSCTVLDMFHDPMNDTVHTLLRLPSGALRCTLIRGAAMSITRSVATTTLFTAQTVMRGMWTRYNGPLYLFSGEGTVAPRCTSGLLASASPAATPETNTAYDPLKAPIQLAGVVSDSLIAGVTRVNSLAFILTRSATDSRVYLMSDRLADSFA